MRFGLVSLLACGIAVAEIPGVPDTVVQGNNQFAVDLYRALSAKPGNVFFSPFNVSHALAMAFAGSKGDTARQIASAMHISLSPDRFHPAFAKLVSYLSDPGRHYQLLFATRLWGEKQRSYAPAFVGLLEKQYGAGLERLDFANSPERARRVINDWVQTKTNSRIRELLTAQSVTSDTLLVLTSAIYFKAAWSFPFEEKLTTPGDFHLTPAHKVQVPLKGAHDAPQQHSRDVLLRS